MPHFIFASHTTPVLFLTAVEHDSNGIVKLVPVVVRPYVPVFLQQDSVGERHGRGVSGGVLRAMPVTRSAEAAEPAGSRTVSSNRYRRGRQ